MEPPGHGSRALGAEPKVTGEPYVEVELTPEAHGPHTLRLWAEGGTRLVTLHGVPLQCAVSADGRRS